MSYQVNIVHVVNRTTKPLDVTDDGRPFVIPPGYIAVPDIDPETNAQRTEKVTDPKDPKKKLEVPKLIVVGASAPDKKTGVQVPSHDGKPYEHAMLAGAAVRARRQHILRGSQDPVNPQFAEPLVGIVEIDDPVDHQEQLGEEVELLDRSLLSEGRQKAEVVRNPHHLSKSRRRSLVDARLTNITGLRMDY
jgi:hypothetical protein